MSDDLPARLGLRGALWLRSEQGNLGGRGRVALLRAVEEHGSITQAARAFGMSYKAAWDAVNTMNTLAGEPLVVRTTGGRGGGSSTLTERGRQLIARFEQLEAIHRRFVDLLDEGALELGAELDIFRTFNMKTSARNELAGTVSALRTGAVNDEVELTLSGGEKIVAVITRDSTAALGLQPGVQAFALVPASAIIVSAAGSDLRLSARNQLEGKVTALLPGAVNAEVRIELAGGAALVATVTLHSAESLNLAVGSPVVAIFKASSVILGAFA